MAGYPNLHPSGFVEFETECKCGGADCNKCSGPALYRGQPSRESRGVLLNEFMEKYNPSGRVTDYKFMETLRDLKEFSRNWPKIPKNIQTEVLSMLRSSDNDLSTALGRNATATTDYAGKLQRAKDAKQAKAVVNDMIEHFGSDADITCVDNRMDAFRLTIVAVVSIIIAFLIFMSARPAIATVAGS